MDILTKLENWAAPRRQNWFTVFRIALGIFIVYKGVMFMIDSDSIRNLSINEMFLTLGIAHIVVPTHLIGGTLITLGIFTRMMSLIQVPVLLGAVILVNFPKGFLSLSSGLELEVSILVLLGLIFFFVFGAGHYSIDELRRKDKERLASLGH